ncbi:MAG TPA: iron ABC transporter permease [Candidatus Limnocylindria bacterium]|nr:iron ABC transporter permease [Candidatus Limnocylindria bacterium]
MDQDRQEVALAARGAPFALPALPSSGVVVPALAALLLILLTALPLGMLAIGSLQTEGTQGLTLANYLGVYGDPRTYRLLQNSFLYALGTSAVAILLGTSLAYIVERTNVPMRRAVFAVTLVPLIVPGIVSTIAWIYLASGKIGVLNKLFMALFGLQTPPFDVYGMLGMIWTEGLHLSPLVFLVMVGSMRAMDPSLEEAAVTSGARPLRTLRMITLPMLVPALAASMLIMFVRGLESFEVPALLGIPARIPVFTSEIYLALRQYPQDYGVAGALGMGLLLVSAVGVWTYGRLTRRAERFATITGKGYRPRRIDLGKWRWVALTFMVAYVLVVVVLPFLVLLFVSLLPFYIPSFDMLQRLTLKNYVTVLEHPDTLLAARNSLILAIASASITMALTAVIAWIVIRTRLPGRRFLDLLAFLPIGIPGLVLAVAIVFELVNFPIPIYGTLAILVIAYVTRYLPYGMRTNSAAMLQLHRELEEAAAAAGASWWITFRRIVVPLLWPSLVAGWIYVFVVSVRELSSSVLLVSPQSVVISFVIFDLQVSGQSTAVAALSVVLVVALVVIVGLTQGVSRRVGVREG